MVLVAAGSSAPATGDGQPAVPPPPSPSGIDVLQTLLPAILCSTLGWALNGAQVEDWVGIENRPLEAIATAVGLALRRLNQAYPKALTDRVRIRHNFDLGWPPKSNIHVPIIATSHH